MSADYRIRKDTEVLQMKWWSTICYTNTIENKAGLHKSIVKLGRAVM